MLVGLSANGWNPNRRTTVQRRREKSKLKTILPAIVLALAFPLVAHGHGGGLDANGGHHDRKNGGYHYHRKTTLPAQRPEPPRPVQVQDSTADADALKPQTDKQIKRLLIGQSIASYSGSCPCPYNTDRAGRRCGKRSAYSKPGGASPLCYDRDVSDGMVAAYREDRDLRDAGKR